MGQGQILLLIAAFMLLSHLSLSVKNLILTDSEIKYEAEATIFASSLAQAMLQEVSLTQFDQKSIGKDIPIPDSLTAPQSLGKDAGENFPNFNDLDDYRGYHRSVANPRLGRYQVDVVVAYANANGDTVNTRTFYKKINITVSDSTRQVLKNPVQLSTIISY